MWTKLEPLLFPMYYTYKKNDEIMLTPYLWPQEVIYVCCEANFETKAWPTEEHGKNKKKTKS